MKHVYMIVQEKNKMGVEYLDKFQLSKWINGLKNLY